MADNPSLEFDHYGNKNLIFFSFLLFTPLDYLLRPQSTFALKINLILDSFI
jgi:hypothetical protein